MNKEFNKYVTPEGIDIIQNLRILVQDPNNFNDPFDSFIGVKDLSEDEVVEYISGSYAEKLYRKKQPQENGISLEEFKTRLKEGKGSHKEICDALPDALYKDFLEVRKEWGRKDSGVVCFSSEIKERDKEVLLWSHYAASHKGLRILFDTSKIKSESRKFDKVEYLEKRLLISPLKEEDKILLEGLITKSIVWQYESEYRWLISYEECSKEYDSGGIIRHYIGIEPEAILRVDLGVNMSSQLKDAVKIILKEPGFKHVKLFQAKLNRKEYALDFDLIEI